MTFWNFVLLLILLLFLLSWNSDFLLIHVAINSQVSLFHHFLVTIIKIYDFFVCL